MKNQKIRKRIKEFEKKSYKYIYNTNIKLSNQK